MIINFITSQNDYKFHIPKLFYEMFYCKNHKLLGKKTYFEKKIEIYSKIIILLNLDFILQKDISFFTKFYYVL